LYDLVIHNACIVDGTGNPWYTADIGVKDGRIEAIGSLSGEAGERIEAAGRVLAPGFIDVHTHVDRNITKMPWCENYLRQGVTTVVGGNCGSSRWPVARHLAEVEQSAPAINYAMLVGHGTIRNRVMGGAARRRPTEAEMQQMVDLVRQGLTEGAIGMSAGLRYVPGYYAETSEVIELAKPVAGQRRPLSIHIRDEANLDGGLVEAVSEAVEIAAGSGVSVEISHLKCLGQKAWHMTGTILQVIEAAREKGLDVTFDQYPYIASSTSIAGALVPRWAQEGGGAAMRNRLRLDSTGEDREKIRSEMAAAIEERGGPESLVIAANAIDPQLNGLSLSTIGKEWGIAPVDVAIEMQLRGGATLISFNMCEADVERIMKHWAGMVASDGDLWSLGEGHPHPRSYGTFPRVLGTYVRRKKVLRLEEAIRKMTSFPARRLGLRDRGIIAEGFVADLVLFDPEQIADQATFEQPHAYCRGIDFVVVGGEIVLVGDELTGRRPGRVLRGEAR